LRAKTAEECPGVRIIELSFEFRVERERERERERILFATALHASKLVPILSNTYNERLAYTKENIHRQRRNRQYGKKQIKKKTNCVHIQ